LAEPIAVVVTEPSQVGEARRAAVALANLLGFDETEIAKVALVVTETASNLVKHAAGGIVLLTPIESGGVVGVEVLALDRGPGVADLAACLRDGFSTAGTPGTGLGRSCGSPRSRTSIRAGRAAPLWWLGCSRRLRCLASVL